MRQVLYFLLPLFCLALSCEKSCLKVLENGENGVKCYCTEACEKSLADLQKNCSQLIPDPICGDCLECAKTQQETCGGIRNVNGTCQIGFKCAYSCYFYVFTFLKMKSKFIQNAVKMQSKHSHDAVKTQS